MQGAMRALVLAALCSTALALDIAVASSLKFDLQGAKERPVSKVIKLLQEMQQQLEKEATEDEEIYDKLACWCATNDREKSVSITVAQARITDLTTHIEDGSALGARLDTEITGLQREVAKNQEALEQATALRQKQLAAFNQEEKDLLGSVSALKAAITVLSKHHQGSLLQLPRSHMLGVAASVQHELDNHAAMLQGQLTQSERQLLAAFVQAPESYFNAENTFKQSYAPQSGQIFGILKQMQETFEANLASAQRDEAANQQSYEDVKAAKQTQIMAGQALIETKSQELAETKEKVAHHKQDIEDTRKSLSADEQFLLMLKEKCQLSDKEWEARQKARQTEIEAVSKAVSILNSDAAHNVFTRTFNPALLQRESAVRSTRRARAVTVLAQAARKLHSPRLATLATRVRLDAFERVKKAIDDMVTQLLKEKSDEIGHKDYCVDELNQNSVNVERKEREKEGILAKIEDLNLAIEHLSAAIDTLKGEISEMQVQLNKAGEDREKENREFQTTVADQRETQKLLKQALLVLEDVYSKKGASLVQGQQRQPVGALPPPGFDTYKQSQASGGVLGLIQQIIVDAQASEKETLRSEEEAQQAYEDFVKETNASIEAKSSDITNKSSDRARAEKDLVEAKDDQSGVLLELEQLSNSGAQLHQSCDFILKNFELRQTARDEEVEALRQAKAILSGANFQAFLQGKGK